MTDKEFPFDPGDPEEHPRITVRGQLYEVFTNINPDTGEEDAAFLWPVGVATLVPNLTNPPLLSPAAIGVRTYE